MSDETCILKVANDVLHGSYEGILPQNIFFPRIIIFFSHASVSTGNSDIALQSIDPIKSKVMRVVQDSGPVVVEAKMMNFELYGFSKGNFYKFKGFDKNELQIGLKTPAGIFKGPYNINGKVLIIPVTGEGTTNTKFCRSMPFFQLLLITKSLNNQQLILT